jgi:hypothetical protein
MSRINKEKVLEKTEVKKYTLFMESKTNELVVLLDVYKKDPYKARVLFYNSGGSYYAYRSVCFERVDGSFEICNFTRKFGISKTNRIYSRETKNSSLIYKDKKFYFKQKTLKHAKYEDIKYHFNYAIDFLTNKFSWLRNIAENGNCHHIGLSTIIRYKLFNASKVLKHLYKSPKNVINLILKNNLNYNGFDTNGRFISVKDWAHMRPYLINIENLKIEFINSYLFYDAIKMAKTLDKKVNCSWSLKRLETEHNNWSDEINKIALEFEPIIELNPYKIYEDFEKFTGFKLLKTNHELILEGKKQKHCVGTYSDSVKTGYSGIYLVNGYTLEVNYRKPFFEDKLEESLQYSQLRGYRNAEAPEILINKVKELIYRFNRDYDYDEYKKWIIENKKKLDAVLREVEEELFLF